MEDQYLVKRVPRGDKLFFAPTLTKGIGTGTSMWFDPVVEGAVKSLVSFGPTDGTGCKFHR